MSNNQNQEYQSLWDVMHVWDSQGFAGKMKWAAYIVFIVFLLFVFLPSILAPVWSSSETGPTIATILYVAIIAAIQIAGNKLKIEVKRK
jgi:hypothetical protein